MEAAGEVAPPRPGMRSIAQRGTPALGLAKEARDATSFPKDNQDFMFS